MRVIPPPNNTGPKPRVSWLGNAIMLRALVDGPCTIEDLREETGLSESTVRGYIGALKKRKLIRICDYQGRHQTYVYEWAPDKRDARKPPRKTAAQRSYEYRERRRLAAIAAALTMQQAQPPTM